MKNLRLVILLLLAPLTFFGQETETRGQLTGLWIGSLSNDSTSIRQDQSFEIALTEYRGKVYGYSRSTFIVNDTLYYIVKRVKGSIDGPVCEVKDDEIVSCNFPKRLEKGVKVIHTFRLNETDSTWQLDGNWKTTQTKKYYSVSGKSDLSEEKDIDNSKIFPHLEELNLAKDIPFYVEAKKNKQETLTRQLAANKAQATSIRTEQQMGMSRTGPAMNNPGTVKTTTVAVNNEIVTLDERAPQTAISTEQQSGINKTSTSKASLPVKTTTIPVSNEIVTLDERAPKSEIATQQQAGINKPNLSASKSATVKSNTVAINTNIVMPEEKKPIIATQPVKPPVADKSSATPVRNQGTVSVTNNPVAKAEEKKQPLAPVRQDEITKTTSTATTTPVPAIPANVIAKLNAVDNPAGAAMQLNERKTDAQQTIEFKRDSIEIAVYDNGEIDGDTVSVLLNGEVVLAKQGLKASAMRKTLYLPAGGNEDLTLVLYAENLGKYPPNTGLLVIYDGDDKHYVRFSADLQKNAAVLLRRKK